MSRSQSVASFAGMYLNPSVNGKEVVVEHVLSDRREGRHRSAVEGVREAEIIVALPCPVVKQRYFLATLSRPHR